MKVTDIKEVPEPLKPLYASLEEFHEELGLMVSKSAETDKLMVKMLDQMTSSEAEEVKKGLAEITMSMNDLFEKRLSKAGVTGLRTGLVMLVIAELMSQFKEATVMTAEQHIALRVGGAYEGLLTDPREKKSV